MASSASTGVHRLVPLLLLVGTVLQGEGNEHRHNHHHHQHHRHRHQHHLYNPLPEDENLIDDDFPRPLHLDPMRSFRSESINNITSSSFFPTLPPMSLSSTTTTTTTTPSPSPSPSPSPPTTETLVVNEIVNDQTTTTGSSINYDRKSKWNFTEVNLANKHLFYIRTQFACSEPKPKLVKVLDYHASPSKQYVPRCTVLHRCDDESGCCEDVTNRCEPVKTEMVELYFHVIRSDVRNNITGGNAVGIERLTFLNHTRCECRPINYFPRTVPLASASVPIYNTSKRKQPKVDKSGPTANNNNNNSTIGAVKSNAYHKCRHVIKCPEPFVYRLRESDHRCVCDCHGDAKEGAPSRLVESHKACLAIQTGDRGLESAWARCVRIGECAEPVCGVYWREYSQLEARCRPVHRLRHGHRRASRGRRENDRRRFHSQQQQQHHHHHHHDQQQQQL